MYGVQRAFYLWLWLRLRLRGSARLVLGWFVGVGRALLGAGRGLHSEGPGAAGPARRVAGCLVVLAQVVVNADQSAAASTKSTKDTKDESL